MSSVFYSLESCVQKQRSRNKTVMEEFPFQPNELKPDLGKDSDGKIPPTIVQEGNPEPGWLRSKPQEDRSQGSSLLTILPTR